MNWNMKSMKAQIGPGSLIPFITVLIVAIVLLTVGTYVTFTVGNTQGIGYSCAGTPCTGANYVANPPNVVSANGTSALSTISTWFTILGIVFIAAVVIGLLLYAFGGNKGGAY